MKRGFTLIELIIVITIIAILTTVTIANYNKTRASAELSLLIDSFITDLREMKSKVANASGNKCLGFSVNEDGEIMRIEADYENPFTHCGEIEETKRYGSENLNVAKILRQNQAKPLESVNILFTPPRGDTYIPELDADGFELNKDNIEFELEFAGKSNEQFITINRQNGTIQKGFRDKNEK